VQTRTDECTIPLPVLASVTEVALADSSTSKFLLILGHANACRSSRFYFFDRIGAQ
jgi:hypothetical protein